MAARRHTHRKDCSPTCPLVPAVRAVLEGLEPRILLAAAPPVLLRDPSLSGQFVDAGGGKTFFTEAGGGLLDTNGTAGGTLPLPGFGGASSITAIGGGEIYFTSTTGVRRSDGTVAGTVQVMPSVVRADGFTEAGGLVYFYAEVGNVGSGLWKTDGTAAGTSLVAPVKAKNLTTAGGKRNGERPSHGSSRSEVELKPGVQQQVGAVLQVAQAAADGEQQRQSFGKLPVRADVAQQVVAGEVLVRYAVKLGQQFELVRERVRGRHAVNPLVVVVLHELVADLAAHFEGAEGFSGLEREEQVGPALHQPAAHRLRGVVGFEPRVDRHRDAVAVFVQEPPLDPEQ
jgi:ELWxxDGT repeat protein